MELRKCIKSARTLINKLNKLLKFGGERKAKAESPNKKPPKPNKEDRNRWGFPCAKQR
jgi:hypothetical protein